MSNSFNKQRHTGRTTIRTRSLLGSASLAALIALGAPSIAHAQDSDKYWDANGTNPGSGGNGNWDTSSPVWSDANSDVLGPYDTWDNSTLDNAIFGITASGTTTTAGNISLTSPITVHNMTFQTVNGWTLSGNTLTLAGAAPTLTVNGDTAINSVLAGTAGMTKLGGRALTLTGANTFSGGITLGGGTLIANTDAALGALSNNIAVTANSTLNIQSGATHRTVDIASGATLLIQGVGSGSALFTGAGNINVNASGGVSLTNDANTYTGTTRFNGCNGVCGAAFSSIGNLGEASSLGAPTDAVSGTILFAQSSQYSDSVVYIGDGDSSNRNWILQGAAAVIRNQGTGTLAITGNVTTNGGASYSAESADIALLGTLSGVNYAFSGNAGRTITLGGANDFTGTAAIGTITLKASVLADIGVNSSLGAGSSLIALSTNGTLSYTGSGASSNRLWSIANTSGAIANDGTGALNLSGAVALGTAATANLTLGGAFTGENTLSGVISGIGNIISTGSGTWNLSGANTFTGGLTVNGGGLQAGSASAFGNNTGVTVNGGTLDLNDFNFVTPTLNGSGGMVALGTSGALTVNGAVASSYAGAITGGGGLTKMGNGTLTLTGANSFTGGTTIVGGTLALDFSGAGGPASDILANGSALTLSGGTLHISGANGEANSQTFGATNVVAGSNTLGAESGAGGSVTLNLGTISRSGGLVNFVLPASGAITTSNAEGLLGGWATINGTDYAKVLGGDIVAFDATDYTTKDNAATWLNGEIISDADGNGQSFSGTVAGSIQIGGLKYSEPSGSTVTIATGQQLAIDGTILVAPSVGIHDQVITGGSLTGGAGGGTLGIQQNGGGTFTIVSTIVDNGGATSFVKGGAGTVRLNGTSNSYTGGTTLSGGQLNVMSLANGGAASSIGASTADSANLVLESGTLAYVGSTDVVTDRGFTLVNGGAGAPAISIGSGRTVEFSGQATSPDDAGLTKIGWGTLVLSNASNDYVGVTTIDSTGNGGAGAISVSTLSNGGVASGIGAASSDSANLVLTAGGRLQYTGSDVAVDRGFTVTNGGGRIDVSQAATTLTISGAAVGTGQFVKDGAGVLVLSGTNTYTGGTLVNAGTLVAGSVRAFGGAAGGVGVGGLTVNAGATVDLAGNSVFVGGLNGAGSVLLGNATLNINSSGNFSGTISGSGGISVTRFTQAMTGCNNSYTGVTSITSTLTVDCLTNGGQASGVGAASSDPANLVIGGTLVYTGGTVTIDRGFTTAGQITVNNAGTTLTITGVAAGGSLTKDGLGTLVLAGTTTRTGATVVQNGTLRAGRVNAFGTGGMVLGNVAGVLLDLNGFDTSVADLEQGGALGGNIDLNGATLTIATGTSSATSYYQGMITGDGNLVKNGSAGQRLTGCASDYAGTTTVNGGVLIASCLVDGGVASSIGASDAGAGNLILNGGTLRYAGTGDSTNRQFTLGTSGGGLDASGTGTITFASTAAITLAGTGNRALTLTGTNTGDNILAAQITNPGTGATSLVKTGVGTWRLTNQTSDYTGVTTISGGVLSVDKLANGGLVSSIGMASNAAASLVIGSGGTLRYTGTGDSTDRRFTLGVGTTAIESSGSGAVVFNNIGAVSYTGNGVRVVSLGGTNTANNIMGATIGDQTAVNNSSLAKNGVGTWILTGANSYTGVTNVNAGTLILGNGGTTGSVSSATINNFGLLGFNRSDTLTYGGVISQTGAVEQIGAGTTILTGDSNYSGGTTISAGVLQLGNGGTTGSVTGPIVDNGTLAFDHSNVVTYAGLISGTGSVHQMGSGTLILSGTNTYAGGTTIDGGGAVQITSDANLGDAGGGVTFDNGTLQVLAPITTARDFTLAGNGTINTDTGFNANSSLTVTGDITGPGALTKDGIGKLTILGDATYTGGTTISRGNLLIGNGGTTGSIVGDIIVSAGTGLSFNRSDSYTYAGSVSGSGGLTIGGGIANFTGNSNFSGSVNIAGTVAIGSELRITTGNTFTTTGATSVNRGTLTVSGAGSTYVSGSINAVAPSGPAVVDVENGGVVRTTTAGLALRGSGTPSAASLTVSGTGSLLDLAGALTMANVGVTNTARMTISAGGTVRSIGANVIGATGGNTDPSTFTITGAGSNWTSTGTLAMSNGSFSLLDGGAASFASATIGSAPQAATVLLSDANSSFATTGDLTLGTGTGTGIITLSDAARLTVGGTFTLADVAGSTGVLNIGGAEGQGAEAAGFYDSPTLAFGAGTGRLNFNHIETNYTFAAAMSGAGTINQVAGVTNLTGNSTAFAGTTNVSGGTLKVNGTLGNATSVLNVLSGGTLGGAGTIGGNVSIADGILAPGNSPGTLTIAGNLALAATSVLNFEFGEAGVAGGALNDLVNVGGNLTLDGTINVTEPAGGTFGVGIYRVFNYGGVLTNNGLEIGTVPGGQTVQVQTSVAGQVNLVNTTGLAYSFWDGDAGPKGNNVINGGNGTWHLAGADANWTNATGAANDAWSDGTTAIFAGAAGTVTVDDSLGNVTVAGMQFATNAYRIIGNGITLLGPQATIQVGDGSAAGAGYVATIDADLVGNSTLVKTDLGKLVLTGVNSYAGGTEIDGGSIEISSDLNLGAATGGLSLNDGMLGVTATMTTNRDIALDGADTIAAVAGAGLTLGGDISGAGSLTIATGVNTFVILTGDATHTGGTTLTGSGTFQVGNGGTTGSILGDIVNNSTLSFSRSDAYTYAGSITGTGKLLIASSGVITLTGNSNYAGGTNIANQAGTLRIADGALVTSGGLTTLGRSTLTVDGANTIFSTASFAGLAIGNGTMTVNVTNGGALRTTTGDLVMRPTTTSSRINVNGAASLLDVAGGIQGNTLNNTPFSMTIDAAGTVRTAGASQIGSANSSTNPIAVTITGAGSNWTSTNSLLMTAGSFTLGNGGAASFTSASFGAAPQAASLQVSDAGSSFTTTGDLTVGSGTGTGVLTLSDGGHVTVGGNFVLADNATATGVLNIGGAEGAAEAATGQFDAATLNLGSATSRINFNHNDPDYVFATVISGGGAVNQAGSGTTILTGASNYSGATNVNGGTLLVNGDQTNATGLTSVNAGGTLGGVGIIGGNVIVADGGTLAPGDATGPGTLAIKGNLALSSGTTLNYDFGRSNVVGGPLNDLTKVGDALTGDLTLDGTINVAVSSGGSFDVGLYRVISYGGALTDNGLDIGSVPSTNVFAQTSVAGQVNLVNADGANVNFWEGTLAPRGDGHVGGGDGVWQNVTGNDNWTLIDGSLNAPFQDNSFAIFAAAPGTVTVDDSLGAVTASGMQFASNGYTVTGDPLTLTPGAVIRVGDGTADGANYTATIASAVTGAGDVVKTDLGTLVLTGANTFAGDAYVAAGELRLADGGTLSNVGSYIGRDTGSDGTVTVTGHDTSGNASTWTTTGDFWIGSDGFGTLNIADGGKVVSSSGIIGANAGGGAALVTGAGSTWNSAGRISVGLFGTGSLRIEDGATVSSSDGIVGDGSQGDAVVTGAGSSWVNAGQLTVGSFAAGTLRIEDGANVTSNQGYIGAGAGSDGHVTVTGAGSNWLVTTSTITVGNNGSGSLSIEDGGLVHADGGLSIGAAAGSSGTVALRGAAAERAVLETSQIGAGLGTVSFSVDGGVLRTTQDIDDFFVGFDTQGIAIGLGANGAVIDTDGHDIGIAPSFVGAGGLTKDGLGTLTLSGANSYTGATDLLTGTLFVNGDQSAATGLTTVAAAATLGGIGTIGGSVDMTAGGTLAPGSNGVGTLTINGNLALGASSILNFEFGQANTPGGALNDLVNVGGNLTLDGTINVTVPTGGTFGPGIYRVFNYGGTLTNNGLALGGMPAGSTVSVQTAVAGQVNLVNTAGLTLSFWDGDAGPKNNGLIDGGNGTWRLAGGGNNWTGPDGAINADYAQDSFAIFAGTPGTVTIDNGNGDVRATGMQFASDGYVIAGDPLTLTGSQAIVQVGDGSAASAGYTATIDAALQGSAQLVKTDAGTLVLTGTNSYTGGTAINGGTLRIASDANLGDAAGGLSVNDGTLNTNATMNSSRVIDLAGTGTFAVDAATALNLDGVISGTGAFIKQGDGKLTLTADNSYTGGTIIATGSLQIGNGGTTGSVVGDIVDNGELILARSDSYTITGQISGTGAVRKVGGTTILTGDNSYTGGTTNGSGVLQLGDGGTTGSIVGDVINAGTLAFNRSNDYVFSGVISDSGDVEQDGTGTTTLTGANSYTGAMTVNAGTLLVNGDQTAANGLTSVASGATLGGIGTIGGDVTVADGGTLAPGVGGAGALTINGNLSLASGSSLAYDFGAANAVGSPLNDVVNVGGNLTLDGTINIAVTPGGAFDIGLYRVANYGGTLTDNGLEIGTTPAGADVSVQTSVANQVNLINTGGAVLNFWDGAAGPKFNNAVDGGDGVWQNGSGNDNWADMTGAVNAAFDDGSFAIFTGTAGTVTVDNSLGAVTASGLQFATDGYRITGDNLTLTSPQSVIRVGDGTAAGAGYTATIASAITGAAQLVKTDLGTLVLTGTNSYTGGTAINGGTLQVASDANLGDAAGGLGFDGGTLRTTADMASARAIDLAGQAVFSTAAGTTLTLTGDITGTGGLGKTDTGTLVLGGTGSYTGGTQIAQGTLLVNGDYAAVTGATMVGSGASLGGTGTIGGSVTLADGAILTPGAGGAGTLTIGGNLMLSGGTELSYQFGQAGVAGGGLNDLVNVGGNLTLDGTIDVTETAGGTFGPGIYRVINYGGTLTDNGLTLGGLPAGSNVIVQTSVAGQVNLINAAGATLNFWDGAAGPKNDGVINGGNGVWQSNAGNNNWTDADGIVNGGYSDGAFAVFQGTGGTVTVDNSLGQVNSGGMQFAANGYTIAGQSIALTDPQTTIRVGDGSTAGAGFTATINAVLSGDTQLVKTDAGTLVLGGANTFTGGVAINGGTVQVASDTNLGAAPGGVSLANGTLATSADITSGRNVTMAGAGTISTADATTFTLNGQIAGTGALTKAGAGTLLLTSDNSAYTAATSITGGTLAVTGKLGGAVAVNGGTRLEGTGSVGAVTNAGTVAPGRNGFGTLTTTGYTGAGGKLEIEAALGDDASQTDLLVVNGATAGTTEVDVTNRGGLGAQTVNGIKIIDVTGASNGTFALRGDYVFGGQQAVIAGAYGYRLYQGGVSTPTDGDWYLRSALLNPSQPTGPATPLYQPGVPVYEAYGQTLLSLTDLGTLQQRLGDRQQLETLSGKPSGIWGRMESKYARPNAAFSTSSADIDTNSWKAELGTDQVLSERGDGSSLVVGVIGSYGQANANIASIFGNGSIKTKAYSAGATLTWFGPQGFYADGRAQFTWFDSKLKSSVLGKLADSNKGTGQAYSVEVGKRTPVAGSLSVTPQIQMVYSTVGFDAFTDPNGAMVSSGLGDSLKTRWGLSIDRQDATSHLYAVGNISYEWLDGTVTDVSGTPIAHSNDRLWGELGVGGSVLLGGRVTLYTEGSANTALHDFGKSYSLKGTVGLRLAF